jgi:hypothetical protein
VSGMPTRAVHDRWHIGALLCASLALLSAGCGRPPPEPEAHIREALAEAEQAAERGDYETLAARVARDYADREGRDRRALLYTLRGLLMRYPRLELVVTVREIEIISPELARVRLEVLAAGTGPAGWSADAFPVELSLRQEGGGWRVTRAEWGRRPAGGI